MLSSLRHVLAPACALLALTGALVAQGDAAFKELYDLDDPILLITGPGGIAFDPPGGPDQPECEEPAPDADLLGKLDMRFYDFDLDGDRDLLIWGSQGSSRPVEVVMNHYVGPGPIQPCDFELLADDDPTHPLFAIPDSELTRIYDVGIADLDQDGDPTGVGDPDLDMVLGRLGAKDIVLRWDATTLSFTAEYLNPFEESEYCWCLGNGSGMAFESTCDPATDPGCNGCTPSPAEIAGNDLAPCDRRWTTGVAIGDITHDGYPDVVLSYRDSRPRWYRNFGTSNPGVFEPWEDFDPPDPESCFPGNGTRDVQLVDLDGDGELEAIFARNGKADGGLRPCHAPEIRSVIVYGNVGYAPDGHAKWPFFFDYALAPPVGADEPVDPAATGPVLEQSPSLALTVADIDGDGDQDLLQPVANITLDPDDDGNTASLDPTYQRSRVYLNENGVLGTPVEHRPHALLGGAAAPAEGSAFVQVADVNGDGRLDVAQAFNISNNTPDHLWLADGGTDNGVPTFTPVLLVEPEDGWTEDNTRYIYFEDLDGDSDQGFPDLPDLEYLEVNFAVPGASPISRIFRSNNDRPGFHRLGYGGIAGVAGVPLLEGTGELQPGTTYAFDLSGAAPNAPALLTVGFDYGYVPFGCGSIVPDAFTPPGFTLILTTDTTGAIDFTTVFGATWPGQSGGFALYQVWVGDPAAPCGYSASDVVFHRTP